MYRRGNTEGKEGKKKKTHSENNTPNTEMNTECTEPVESRIKYGRPLCDWFISYIAFAVVLLMDYTPNNGTISEFVATHRFAIDIRWMWFSLSAYFLRFNQKHPSKKIRKTTISLTIQTSQIGPSPAFATNNTKGIYRTFSSDMW